MHYYVSGIRSFIHSLAKTVLFKGRTVIVDFKNLLIDFPPPLFSSISVNLEALATFTG